MNIFYQLKDLIILYSNANIMIIYFKFFPLFYFILLFLSIFIFFLLMTRGIWYIHLVHCLVFVCCILYQFSFSYFYLVAVNVYYQYCQEYIYIWKKNSINYIRVKLSWTSSMIVLLLSPLPISIGIFKKLGICYKIGSSYTF